MQSSADLTKSLDKKVEKVTSTQEGANFDVSNSQLFGKRFSLPKFTKFGTLELAENVVPLHLFRKVDKLYSSVVDAKAVLLSHKVSLSTVVTDVEYNCITPLAASEKLPMVFYKREDLTSIKAYKIRGALYQISKVLEERQNENLHFVAASTGNHALGVLKAAEILHLHKVTICISENVTEFKQKKLRTKILNLNEQGVNAQLIVKGKSFDETNRLAQEIVENDSNGFYVDPYNTQNAVAGQGTIGLELLTQIEKRFFDFANPSFDIRKTNKLKEITVIVPMGGGGLISGISCALKTGMNKYPHLRKLKINVVGVKLANFDSKYGDAIKVAVFGEHNTEYIRYFVDRQFIINDKDMKAGMDFVKSDLNAKVEGASAGTLKPVLDKFVKPSDSHAVICILSGGNSIL